MPPYKKIVVSILLAILVSGAGAVLVSCGSDLPTSLPMTQAYRRMVLRADLVELVIADQEKAARVKGLYVEIDDLLQGSARAATADLKALGATDGSAISDDDIRNIIGGTRSRDRQVWARYIKIQLELRKVTTPEEFAQLDGLR